MEVSNRRSHCAFQTTPSQCWRSRQRSATLPLVNSWACSSRLRWRRTFPKCSIRSPRTSQNKNVAASSRAPVLRLGSHSEKAEETVTPAPRSHWRGVGHNRTQNRKSENIWKSADSATISLSVHYPRVTRKDKDALTH